METPDTQGQQAESVTPTGQQAEPQEAAGGQQKSGFQERIDELTRLRREAERQLEEARAYNQQLLSVMAEQTQRPAQTQQDVQPLPDIDPEERRKYAAMMEPLMRQVAELKGALGSVSQQLQYRDYQQAVQSEDPRVTETAEKLLRDWRRDASKGGWTMTDAVVYARGLVAEQDRKRGTQARTAQNHFNAMSQTVLTGQNAPPIPTTPQKSLPTNFEQLSPSKQAELLEERLAGVTF